MWLQWRDEKERNNFAEAGGREVEGELVAGIPAEDETLVDFAPQDLPTTVKIGIRYPILQAIMPSSVLHDVSSRDAFTGDQVATVSSPTLNVSTISYLTPPKSGEHVVGGSDKQIQTRHETFYLEDGNVEIVCGHTIFRIHSPVVSFSSPNLRNMLSPSTLLNAPMPEGCPRVVFEDSAEDLAVLLKMIYMPG